MTAIPSPRKPKGAASDLDVAKHVIIEHIRFMSLRSENPDYLGSEQEKEDIAWLQVLQSRVPEEKKKKNLNPIKAAKKGK